MNRRDFILASAIAGLPFPALASTRVNVRDAGARGDGKTLDTAAFNAAIRNCARAGGGIVVIPKGRYRCFTIHLASRVSLAFEDDAVLIAADPATDGGAYDVPEDRGKDLELYQDFGHSHWNNSLIVGDDVQDVTIAGPGTILGTGLTRNGPGARWQAQTGERPLSMRGMPVADIAKLETRLAQMRGLGNKAIALRGGSRIRIADLTIDRGGHIAILATGTSGLAIEKLRIDSERDGIDLDCVRDARVEHCRVNTPNDDAIVVKSSYALGRAQPSEQVVIRDCHVSGYDLGTMLDGTNRTTQELAPDRDRPTGRIKLGTESNGGYRDVLIERCRFDHCRGLALETVDGGDMENVTARDLVMDDITTAPIFVRIGARQRGPEGTGIGTTRGVRIADLTATGIDHRFPAALAGLPGHPVTDVTLSNVRLAYRGGGTAEDAALRPPEHATAYPEPSMFGVLPAWGLWMRHTQAVTIDRLEMETATGDARPPIVVEDGIDTRATATPLWSRRRPL